VAIKPLQNNLVAFPNLELEEAMREMKLIDTDGHIYGGAESIVRLITYGHPLIGKFLKLYYLPGLRWLADQSYAWVAKNRYRLFGRADLCDDGSCAVHFPDRAKVPEPPKTRRSDLQGH
jgi:predicted DCC family thiol-disulfide oxidoreductase YuxK